MDLHNTYGAVALSAKANVGDGALARQVSGVLGVFPTEVRGAFMGTNRSKLLVDECVSLENRCKELAKRHTGATFLRQVDTRFTAYTQVIGPLIIKQVNAANYLTNFLSSIVSLLPHEMQFRAMKYWNDIYANYTDGSADVPPVLREQLVSAFGSGTSYRGSGDCMGQPVPGA